VVKEVVKKNQLKRVDKDTKRINDRRTEKNGEGYVVSSGVAKLSGTWDKYNHNDHPYKILGTLKKSQLFIQ
jgi:hypothetical protein